MRAVHCSWFIVHSLWRHDEPTNRERTNQRGFTLLELIVVFSVGAILSLVGLAAFVVFNRNQIVSQASRDVHSALSTAKSRAQSQVKPTECTTLPEKKLDGYQVLLSVSEKSYTLRAVCDGNFYRSVVKKLPQGIQFINLSQTTFTFPVLSGEITEASVNGTAITVQGFGSITRSVTVYKDGRIFIN